METPITNHDIQANPAVIDLPKTEPVKKPSATNQQMKAAYIMVLVALMDSLKTSTQTAQVQAKEQNLAINAQESLVNKMQAVQSIRFVNGKTFSREEYWKVVFYTQVIHSGGGSGSNWNKHVIYEKNPVDQTWLDNHVNPNGMGGSTRDKVECYQQQQVPKYFWASHKLTFGSLGKVQTKIELSNETRTIIEGKINIGQQKSMIVSAGINMTVQGLQQLIAEVGNVSHQLGAFSNRIASI